METSSNEILSHDLDEICDWYMVSHMRSIESRDFLAEFKVEDETFRLVLSDHHKCPRCWKFDAKNEDELCPRCQKVLNVK